MKQQAPAHQKALNLMPRLGFASSFAAAPAKTQTVDELSERIKLTIESVPDLRNVAVRGELQNFKRHSSGHVYFTLLGKDSRISAVLFRSHAMSVITWPQDGDEVLVTGSVEVYPKGGAYQLYASRLMPIGLGAQSRAREELRSALEREGLFDIRHKRSLPKYPARVAVVTSPTGAALHDILKVSSCRAPFVDLVLVPALVQGFDAPQQIAGALAAAGALKDVSCVILARGGGAKDDLSPFDDERVVRAVRACPLPVVAGIGHQTDSSLADMAADISLPTPSAAAERVFPDSSEMQNQLSYFINSLDVYVGRANDRFSALLDKTTDRAKNSISKMISEEEAILKNFSSEMRFKMNAVIEREDAKILSMASMLDVLSPLAVLARGYSICKDQDGRVIRSASGLKIDQAINIQLHDGRIGATVKEVRICE